jgi:two-component system, cell cycle sensor histidine kinase and response regulator CckA
MGKRHTSSGDGKVVGSPAGRRRSEPYLRWLEAEVREGRADLQERINELECLFSVDRELRRTDDDWRTSLQRVVDLLPSGFRSPARTAVRVRWGDEEFSGEGFESTRYRLSKRITAGDQVRGEIEVGRAVTEEESTASFGPEEESLLSGVADRLGEALGRREAEGELRDSEAFLQALVRSAPIPLFTIDAQGRVLSWNPAAERTFGWAPDAVVGGPPPIWPEARREELASMLRRALDGESISGLRLACLRHDGSSIDVSLAVAPVQGRADRVNATLFAVQDFSDPSGAWSRNRFQARLLDSVGQAIIATDLDGRIAYWNRAAQELYGWDSTEALGKNIMDLTPALETGTQAEEVMEILRKGERWSGEFETRHRDGSPIQVLVTNAPFVDEQGNLGGIIGASSDIGVLKNLEAQLRQAQKMEALGRLAGGIAHDFNNILTVIQGHSEILLDDLPEESGLRDDIREVMDAIERATQLTRPLLALSRRQVLDLQIQDLKRSTKRMESILRRLVPSRIELSFDLKGDPEWIKADVTQLDQVILNLVVNAVDAVPGAGAIEVAVDRREISQEQAEAEPWEAAPGTYARLSVTDSGTGMSPDVEERIFEPFFTTKPPNEGTGLGLSTVFGIVRQGGGYILVDTAPGRGSTFEVIWPLVKPPRKASEPVADFGSDRPGLPPETPHDKLVLIVDDAPAILRIATRVLEQAGYRALTAANGQEALRMAEAHHPELALVISDVVMPVMGGAVLLERLHSSLPDLPIVLMSGHTDQEVGEDLRAMASGFLPKPFGPRDLIRVVKEATSG